MFGLTRESDELHRRDLEIGSLRAQMNVLLGQVKAGTALVEKLTTTLADLKREGFNPPPSNGVRTDATPDLDPAIIEAIDSRASRRSALWVQLAEEAARASGDAEDIANDIYQGGDPDRFEE